MAKVFVGQDWAEDHHDVFVEDDTGRRLGGGRLPDGVEGVARFHELVADHVEDPAEVMIATETDRGLFIGALVAAGLHGVGGQPDVDVALSGAALDVGREVRSRRRQGARRSGPHRRPQPSAGRR